MTAYTSTQAGDWNSAATWGGGGYPNASGDTATVSHDVTIPAGATITCGACSVGGGETLTVNGAYNLAGALSLGAAATFAAGPGAVIDLNGYNVTPAGDVNYTFQGTANSRITVRSTGSAGSFVGVGAQILPNHRYVDFSGLGDSSYGRSHMSAVTPTYQDCTWTRCGKIELETVGTATNSGLIVRRCDFRNPTSTTPVTSSSYYPIVWITGAKGSNPRVIEYCTWSTDRSEPTPIVMKASSSNVGISFRRNVLRDCELMSTDTGAIVTENLLYRTLHVNADDSMMALGWTQMATLARNYSYYSCGGHPYWLTSSDTPTVINNVFETQASANEGTNWFLSAGTVSFVHNLFIGQGNVLTYVINQTVNVNIKRNTINIGNNATTSGSHTSAPTTVMALAPTLLTEQSCTALAGTMNISYNLMTNPSGTRDYQVDCIASTADQVDTLGNNVGWDFGGGLTSPPVPYDAHVVVTSGAGTGDSAVNPQYMDRTRTLATWDSSLGGAGTAANAVTELLKLNGTGGTWNSAYSTRALISYVFDGYKVQASSLRNASDTGGPIGAANYHKSTRSLATFNTIRSGLNGTYSGISV